MNEPTKGHGGGPCGIEPKKLAVIGGGLLLGWALLENAYRDGLQTGLMLSARGGNISMRDLHGYGFPFGPWLLIAAIVGVVGWRKGWWGSRPGGPGVPDWRRMAPPPPPPAPTRVPVSVAPSEWAEGPRQSPPAPPTNEHPNPQGPPPSAPPPTNPGAGPVV
ncbi:MAG: hypothetical protein IT337_04420 [Thermomicrobiales bacterium]|nr:hypothetical protein [Thermomicrobiales bacterium]